MNTALLIFILILNGFLLYFLYRFYAREQTLMFRRRIKTQLRRIKRLETKMLTISEVQASNSEGVNNDKNFVEPKTPVNNFQRMEDRHAAELSEVVEVNGVAVESGR